VVTIDPEMAFGTGSHATTRLCLEALTRHVRGGETVLDVGAGSGILAIAAVRLGARRAVGVDTDPVACRVARENVRRNGVARRVRIVDGDLAASRTRPAAVLVANLTAKDLLPLLLTLARRVRPGGLAVFSGILRRQAAAVSRAARAAGFVEITRRRRGAWIALEALRPS
jgi:ribosomal protein L11 methyltransferase